MQQAPPLPGPPAMQLARAVEQAAPRLALLQARQVLELVLLQTLGAQQLALLLPAELVLLRALRELLLALPRALLALLVALLRALQALRTLRELEVARGPAPVAMGTAASTARGREENDVDRTPESVVLVPLAPAPLPVSTPCSFPFPSRMTDGTAPFSAVPPTA